MDFMQIFTLITGVIYILLEIRQKNAMWVVGILTSAAAMFVFFRQGLYASFALNTYYLITAFIGLVHWEKDRKKMKEAAHTENCDGGNTIHLNRLKWKTVLASALILIAGTWILAEVMKTIENPMSYADSATAVLSAVATWWLVKSYFQQWWLWIAANLMSTILCAGQGLWWMTALYIFYTLSSVYGLRHWVRNGRYLEEG